MNELKLMCFGAGFLSVIIHCAMKAQGLKKDAFAANDTSWNISDDYIKVDSIPIFISFCTVLLWHLIVKEAVIFYPKIQDLIIISYSLVGFLGSYFIQQALGKAKGLIRKTIDSKTNQLDEFLNNKKDSMSEILDDVFLIENDTDIVEDVTLHEYAETTGGTLLPLIPEENIDGTTRRFELRYDADTAPASTLTMVRADTTSYFVGHVPRPRKPR